MDPMDPAFWPRIQNLQHQRSTLDSDLGRFLGNGKQKDPGQGENKRLVKDGSICWPSSSDARGAANRPATRPGQAGSSGSDQAQPAGPTHPCCHPHPRRKQHLLPGFRQGSGCPRSQTGRRCAGCYRAPAGPASFLAYRTWHSERQSWNGEPSSKPCFRPAAP